jgi:hypothetical protein
LADDSRLFLSSGAMLASATRPDETKLVQTTLQGYRRIFVLHDNRAAQALVVILAGWALLWSALNQARTPFRVEGVIERTFVDRYNWYPAPRFAMTIKTAQGQHVTLTRLYGGCQAAARGRGTGRSCEKIEFPLGATIAVEGESIRSNANLCRSAATRYRCRQSLFDHISTIRVDGRDIDSGWFGPKNIAAVYVLWLIAVLWHARNNWQLRNISWLGIVGFLLLAHACFVLL